jgi:hypothetical protein
MASESLIKSKKKFVQKLLDVADTWLPQSPPQTLKNDPSPRCLMTGAGSLSSASANTAKEEKSSSAGLPDGTFSDQKYFFVYFGRPWKGKCWYILWPFGIFYEHFALFYTNLENCVEFCCIFPVLVCCSMKNLATLVIS